MYDVLSPRKKKLKRLPSLIFRRSKSEFFLSAITRNWFQLSPLFSQRQLHLWRHTPNARLIYLWSPIDVSRVLILVLAKRLLIQKFILGKVCLKAIVKVALSLQRLASARQAKISNLIIKEAKIIELWLVKTEGIFFLNFCDCPGQNCLKMTGWKSLSNGCQGEEMSVCFVTMTSRFGIVDEEGMDELKELSENENTKKSTEQW